MTLALALLLALLGLALWAGGARRARRVGLGAARLREADLPASRRPCRTLSSARLGLRGRPDFVVRERGALLPVEHKPGRRDERPREGDVLQLAAYMALLEEREGRRVPYGILVYGSLDDEEGGDPRRWEVPFDDALRRGLDAALSALREDAAAPEVPRSHRQPARCARCLLRASCDERLA